MILDNGHRGNAKKASSEIYPERPGILNKILKKDQLILAAVDQAPHGILVSCGFSNKILFANPVLEKILSVSRENLVGKTFTHGFFKRGGKIFYPDRKSTNTVFFETQSQSRHHLVVRGLLVIIHQPQGRKVWALMSTFFVLSKAENVIAIVSILHDITDRKHELDRLDYAMEASVDGLWEWDLRKDEGYLSPRYYQMLGFDNGEFAPTLKAWKGMLHPDDRKEAVRQFKEIDEGNCQTYRSEYRLKTKNGQYRWFRSRGILCDFEKGYQGVRVVGTHLDITRERELELSLYQSKDVLKAKLDSQTRDLIKTNQRLETILDCSSESIWVIDGDGTVVRINQKSEKLLGIRADEVVGKHYMAQIKLGIVDISVTQKAFETGRQVSLIQEALRTGRTLLVTSTPIFDHNGKISMVIVNERDLTQLNKLQEELKQVRGETDLIKEALTELNLRELREQGFIAESKEMQQILLASLKLSHLNISNILILGESGTGKGLLAKFIHMNSKIKKAPFVQINCAALPETLLEAELFGYERGAFTGARNQGKSGLFEMAQGGTLFLDELGELSQLIQAKLLKCIEDKEFFHLGGLKPIKIDCTVIAATNVDLLKQINQKKFRSDLFFRLNTFTLTLPPLRKRPEDILELTMFFLEKYNKLYGMRRRISSKGIEGLQAYPFPGNVRELKNYIKKSVVMSDSNLLDNILDTAPSATEFRGLAMEKEYSMDLENKKEGFNAMALAFEKKILTLAMDKCKNTRSIAAYLKMTQSQVVRKLKKHALSNRLKGSHNI